MFCPHLVTGLGLHGIARFCLVSLNFLAYKWQGCLPCLGRQFVEEQAYLCQINCLLVLQKLLTSFNKITIVFIRAKSMISSLSA